MSISKKHITFALQKQSNGSTIFAVQALVIMIIKREQYVEALLNKRWNRKVKIITGIRRCGKSIVLSQIRDELSQRNDNIIFLNFEDKETESRFPTWKHLLDYVEETRKEGLCYVFLDEIQAVEE